MWSDELLHMLGVVGTRRLKRPGCVIRSWTGGRRVPADRGPSPTFDTPEVLTPLKSGSAKHVVPLRTCSRRGGGCTAMQQ
jgi:hypothetical protein